MRKNSRKAFFYIGTEAELIKLYPIINLCIERNLSIQLICNGQNHLQSSALMTERLLRKTVFLIKRPIWFPFLSFSSRAIWLVLWGILTFFNTLKFLVSSRSRAAQRPIFIVHGDTLSTLIGGVVAKLLRYKIIHVESGLTSGKLLNPFPEEICRRIVIRLADVMLCPTIEAFRALKSYPGKRKIHTHGNTMWDMLQHGLYHGGPKKIQKYFILIIHRQETLANPDLFFEILEMVKQQQPKNIQCVFILHKPTKSFLVSHNKLDDLTAKKDWTLLDRQPFHEFVHLLKNASFVLTDGGSNQEECYYLGVPCYLLRDCTERSEGIGHNVVVNTEFVKNIPWFIRNYESLRRSPVILSKSPSDIIFKEIERECVR